MKVIAEKVTGKNLKAGDLFSTASETYWNCHHNNQSIGEKVYIRTETECPESEKEVEIYRLTIDLTK